jgi:PGF-CTERM protein
MVNSLTAPPTDPPVPVPDPCVDEATKTIYPNLNVGPVTEFPVNMGSASGIIPKAEAFVIHVEWRQFSQTGQKVAQREWNVHTGVNYRNRLVIPVMNPLQVEEVRPQLFEDKIYIHGVFNSPWGSYDVDIGSLMVEILKPDGTPLETSNIGEPILKYSVDHDAHFKPVNATFPWEYKKDNLPPGTYKVRLHTMNWQHTAMSINEATVDFPGNYLNKPRGIKVTSSEGVLQRNIVGKGVRSAGPNIDVQGEEGKGLPGFEGVVVLAALIGAAAYASRRRKE